MLNRILAFILSIVMSLSGNMLFGADCIIDSVAQAVYGVPYAVNSIKTDFLQAISDESIVEVSDDVGYVNNTVMVFLDPLMTFKEKVAFFAGSGGLLIGWYSPANLYFINYGVLAQKDIEAKCEKLSAKSGVTFACPNMAHKYSPDYTPNDPFDGSPVWSESSPRGSNWWLEAIWARGAWDFRDAMKPVKVGIVDSGFDTGHVELDGLISFPNEKSERQNIPDNHGTHVAGIIAAKSDNATGIAGICRTAELVCVDWEPDGSQIWVPDVKILFGFMDVVKAGAKVVNLSLGSSSGIKENRNSRSWIYNRFEATVFSLAMASLLSKGFDFVVVQSAGNGNKGGFAIDASQNGSFCSINASNVTTGSYGGVEKEDILNRIVVVAAAETAHNGKYMLARFSNIGHTVTIAAPGVSVFSTYVDGYGHMSGTSMAAPIVTGVIALIWSISDEFTGAQVKKILTDPESTNCAADPSTDYFFEGLDYYAIPMVNAQLAVEEALSQIYDTGCVQGVYVYPDTTPAAHTIVATTEEGFTNTFSANDYGSFHFMLPVGNANLKIYNFEGSLVRETNIVINKDVVTDLGYNQIPQMAA